MEEMHNLEAGREPASGASIRLPRGPIGRVLRVVLVLVRVGLAMIAAAVAIVLTVYFLHPEIIYEWARAKLIDVATNIAGLRVEVDTMSGPIWREVYLDGVRVHSDLAPTSPIFARFDRVTVQPHWMHILTWTDPMATVTLAQGFADVRLDPKGRPNVHPAGAASTGGGANVLPVHLSIQNLVVGFWDQNKAFGMRTYWRVDRGAGNMAGNKLHAEMGARSATQRVEDVKFDLNLDTKGGQLALGFSDLEPRMLNYLLKNPDARLLSGTASGNIKLSWDAAPPRKLEYQGSTNILKAKVWVRQLPVPLEQVNGHIDLATDRIGIYNTRFRLAGTPYVVQGAVANVASKRPTVDVLISSAAVDLARLKEIAPAAAKAGLTGMGNIHARVSGDVKDPLITGRVGVPRTRLDVGGRPLEVTAVQGHFRMRGQQVQIPLWQANALQGQVQGETRLDLKGPDTIFTRVRWQHISVPASMRFLNLKQHPRFPVSGFLVGRAEVTGTLSDPAVAGQTELQQGRVGDWTAQVARTSFKVRGDQIVLPQLVALLHGPAANEFLRVDGQVREDGWLQAQVRSQNVPLSRLQPFAPQLAGASGRVDFNGHVSGNFKLAQKDWTTMQGQGDMTMRNAVLFEQPIDRATAKWRLRSAMLLLPEVRAIRKETWLSASGAINLRQAMASQGKYAHQEPPQPAVVAGRVARLGAESGAALIQQTFSRLPPFMAINRVDGVVHLQDLPPLRKRTGVQAGLLKLHGSGSVDAAGAMMQIDATLTDLQHPQASVEKISTKLRLDHSRLFVPELLVEQADDKYHVTGWADVMGGNRQVDMKGEIVNGHVPTMLSFMPESYLGSAFEESQVSDMIRGKQVRMRYHLPLSGEHRYFTLADKVQRLRADEFSTPVAPVPSGDAGEAHFHEALTYHEEVSLPPADAFDFAGRANWWEEVDGIVNATATLRGSQALPTAKLELALTQGRVMQHNVDRLQVSSTYQNGQFNLHSVVFEEGPDTTLNASGTIGRDGRTAVDATAKNLDLDWVNPWLTPYGLALGGQSNWTMSVTGTLKNPTAVIDTQITGGRLQQGNADPILFDRLTTLSRLENGVLDVTQGAIEVGDKRITMSGTMPIMNDQAQYDFVANLRDDGFALISMFTKDLQWLGGTGQAIVNLRGTRKQPYFLGSVNLTDARVKLGALEDPLEHVNAMVSLHSDPVPGTPNRQNNAPPEHVDYVNIDSFTAKLNGGDLTADGTMELMSLKPLYFGMRENLRLATQAADEEADERRRYVHLTGRNVVMRMNPLYQGRVDMDLRLRGLFEEPVLLGAVVLSNGVVNVTNGSSSGQRTGEDGEAATAAKGGIDIRFDNRSPLIVTIGENMWVKSALGTALVGDMAVQPTGTIMIKRSAAEPRIEGTIELKRGHVTVLNRRFQVQNGLVDFSSVTGVNKAIAGPLAYINPAVSLELHGRVSNPYAGEGGDTKVTLVGKVSGRLQDLQDKDRLRIEWIEKGNLSDSQVMAILGRQAELEAVFRGQVAQSLMRELTPFLSSYLLGPLSTQLEEFIGLDEFTLGAESDPRATNLGNLNIGVAISLTKTLIKDLSISYTGFFGSQMLNTYSLRYKVLPYLGLVYRVQDYPGDMIHSAIAETGFKF